jgi:hypothetical protein
VFCDDVVAVVIEVVAMGTWLFDIILLVLLFFQMLKLKKSFFVGKSILTLYKVILNLDPL